MLPRFPVDGLYAERAVLLSRLGQHDQALMIYVRKLKDWRMAEQYCDRVWKSATREMVSGAPSRDGGSRIYETLLKIYLEPSGEETESQVYLEPTLKLLSCYGERISPSKV
jgi:hypothetical protein